MSRFTGKRTGIVLAATNTAAHGIFGGKTLNEIGFQHKLTDADISIVYSTNTATGDEIPNLKMVIDGTSYAIPFANKFPFDQMGNADWLLNCEFRVSQKPVYEKDANNRNKRDEDGNLIKTDETEAYLSFGKPSGIVFDREEVVFAEETAETKAKNALAGA